MESPYQEILTLLVGGGLLTGFISAYKAISEAVEAKKKQAAEDARIQLSESSELRKLEHESDEAMRAEFWRIIAAKDKECEKLKEELEKIDNADTLARPLRLQIRTAARGLGRQIEILDSLIVRDAPNRDLITEMEILRQKFDDLEKQLP